MLILVFFTINLVYQVNCENSGNVKPLEIYHITFNENECFVSKNSTIIHQRKESLGTARFVHKGPLNCAWQDDVNLKVEDENVGSNFRKEYIEDPKNLKQRKCTYLPDIVNCTFNFVLKDPTGIKWKKETPPIPGKYSSTYLLRWPKDNEKETPPEKDPKDGGNPVPTAFARVQANLSLGWSWSYSIYSSVRCAREHRARHLEA
ncbi:uncharacterized protein [Epargyreus clarus]|uniref:uncharacterized protein n=1 Tax=Epargyreus clarus TaxID=520877 RepID=UPI003C2BF56F